jgi:hypothetical protein
LADLNPFIFWLTSQYKDHYIQALLIVKFKIEKNAKKVGKKAIMRLYGQKIQETRDSHLLKSIWFSDINLNLSA